MTRWHSSADRFEDRNSAGLHWIKKHKLLYKYTRELSGYWGMESHHLHRSQKSHIHLQSFDCYHGTEQSYEPAVVELVDIPWTIPLHDSAHCWFNEPMG